MAKHLHSICVVMVGTIFAIGAAGGAEVELTVTETAGQERKAEPVTTGVPFPKGALKDVAALTVSSSGKALPAQFLKTVPWDDGSVRWALMDCQVDVPASGKLKLVVGDKGGNPAPAAAVKVEEAADGVKVSTGPLEFKVAKAKFNLFESLKVDGKELIPAGGAGIVFYKEGGGTVAASDVPAEITMEQAGPMRATVCVRGKFTNVKGFLSYTVRITAYAGQKFVKVRAWLQNEGAFGYNRDCGWTNFDGLALELPIALGGAVKASCEGVEASSKFRVIQKSGGQHTFKDLNYSITGGDKELKKGDRTDGVVALSGASGKLNVAVRHFWQNYEKAIELDGTALKIWLWPTEGEWPRQGVKRGRSMDEFGPYRKPGLYALMGGSRKGYETILDFSGRDAAASAATLSQPLMALATPAYYATSRAAPGWFAPMDVQVGKPEYDAKLKAWDALARNSVDPKNPNGLIAASQGAKEGFGFWWGWMDFGDLYWENGACCLHYDWTWIMLLDYLRSGERGFFDMGTAMARHRAEVDQNWARRGDMDMFQDVTHYERNSADTHGDVDDGRSKPNASHHWACGLVLDYMLTGDEMSRECAVASAEGAARRCKAAPGDQARSYGGSILIYCSLYDMTADKKYLELATSRWEKGLVPTWKKADGTTDVTWGDGKFYVPYWYPLYPLCVFHEHTGNPQVLEYLKEAAEKAPPADSVHPIESNHQSNVLAYVGYLTKNEDYIKKAEAAFERCIPPGSPGLSGGSAWSKETAKKLRYGHLLEWFEWQAAQKK